MTSAVLHRHSKHEVNDRAEAISDGNLLEQFLTGAEVESQEAFRALVVRHGPMVFGICRHVLHEEHEAEDAFQATFLVLAQKGSTIRNRRVLAGWLHEVAHRIAIKARYSAVRRRNHERQAMAMSPPETTPGEESEFAAWNELRPVLHAEVDRLPDKYRVPVILSYLEGKTNEEVAAILAWPVGTVKGRLSRARDLLRSRLARRGLALSAAFLLTALSRGRVFAEVVPAELVKRTVRLAGHYGRRPAPPGVDSGDREPETEVALPEKLDALIRVDPKFMSLRRKASGWLLTAAVFLTLSAGIGVAAAKAGGLSNLRSALSELLPAGFGIGPRCH